MPITSFLGCSCADDKARHGRALPPPPLCTPDRAVRVASRLDAPGTFVNRTVAVPGTVLTRFLEPLPPMTPLDPCRHEFQVDKGCGAPVHYCKSAGIGSKGRGR